MDRPLNSETVSWMPSVTLAILTVSRCQSWLRHRASHFYSILLAKAL
jgi:hypothetical protein